MHFKETADRQNDTQNQITTRRLTIMVAKAERSRTNELKRFLGTVQGCSFRGKDWGFDPARTETA